MDDYEPPGWGPGAGGLQRRPKGCSELGDMKEARGLRIRSLREVRWLAGTRSWKAN